MRTPEPASSSRQLVLPSLLVEFNTNTDLSFELWLSSLFDDKNVPCAMWTVVHETANTSWSFQTQLFSSRYCYDVKVTVTHTILASPQRGWK